MGGGGGGSKEECVKEIFWGGWRGGYACGFPFNFSKVTENAIITIKLLIFLFHTFSDVTIGSENSPPRN